MGRKCVISGCLNNCSCPTATVHTFPSVKKPEKRKQWIEFASVSYEDGEIPVKNLEDYGVCSLHFTKDEYVLKENGRKRLKINASPATNNEAVSYLKSTLAGVQAKLDEEQSLRIKLEKENLAMKKSLEKEQEKNTKLQSLFSPCQLKKLLQPSKAFVHWDEEDISKCLALYSLSTSAYELLRNDWKFPLPSESTLLRTVCKLKIEPGVPIPGVLNLLQSRHGEQSINCQKTQCVIALDEIAIDSRYCYDEGLDQAFGEEKYINLLCVRGLFEKWKEPLLYNFNISKEDILKCITYLYEVGLQVNGIVTDQGPKNQKLWKDFNMENYDVPSDAVTYFSHPITNAKVYWISDFTHLIKNLRNNFLDHGIILKSGTVFDKTWILKLLELQDRPDLRALHKLTYKHVNLVGQERQNASTAFEVFSHSTATLIRTCLKNEPNFEEVANFVDLINNLSDLFNSRSTTSFNLKPYQCGYGKYLDVQNNLLNTAYITLSEIKTGARQRVLNTFQKGFLMSILSLQSLYKDLKANLAVFDYLLTYKLTQDYLENVFSNIRAYGGSNVKPNALDFKFRLRKLIVNWNREEINGKADKHLFVSSWSSTLIPETPQEQESQFLHVRRVATVLTNQRFWSDEEFCHEAGKELVAGFIANKFALAHPELSSSFLNEESRNLWISKISDGYLTEPSTFWFNIFRLFEQVFIAFHGENTIKKSPGIVKLLIEEIRVRFPAVSLDLIQYYCRLRTLLRIKHLNRRIEDEKFAWRN